jgi:putative protease
MAVLNFLKGLLKGKKSTLEKPAKSGQKTKPKLQAEAKEKEIGAITHYFGKISVGIVKLGATLKTGDKIHIKGIHSDFKQEVTSMQHNHKSIICAKKGLEVGIKVKERVHENDKVYLI